MSKQSNSKCLNCNHSLSGDFCSACGQKNTKLNLGIIHFIKIALNEVVGYDTRLKTTFKLLFTQPGVITKRHNEGERNSFVQPMRLYLFTSLVMFLSINIAGVKVTSTADKPSDVVTRYNQPDIPLSFYFDITSDNSDAYNDKVKYIAETNRYDELNQQIVNGFSYAMFILLPFFALFTKLLFLNKHRSYTEHLIFSIHFHVYIFMIVTLAVFGNLLYSTAWWRGGFLFCYVIYLIISLKNAYTLSVGRSILASSTIFLLYIASFFYLQEIIKAFIVMSMP
jgi:hypothetical protein